MAADVRAAAAACLGEVIGKGRSLNQVLPGALLQVPERERALLQELCYGTLRFAPRLLALLDKLLDKPLKRKDADLQALLLLGLYQLAEMRLPDHAVINNTVGATKALHKAWARGLTNAVLRRYQREAGQLLQTLSEAAAAAHPDWLFGLLREQWPEQLADIVQASNQRPPLTLRVNALRGSRDSYLDTLNSAGLAASPGEHAETAIRLEQPVDVNELPGFAEGLVSVQDEAAQLAASLVDPQPGQRVLDACAAPGGKACHLLEHCPGIEALVATDLDPDRLQSVRDNLQRLDLEATVLAADAASPMLPAPANFDRILVDAPCSATGVIRRHPDIKLLRRAADLAGFASGQGAILDGLWPLLQPGGILVYATCSILREENDDVVEAFLQRHPEAEVLPIEQTWGLATQFGRQLLPATDGPDGLYYSRLRSPGQA